MSVSGPGSRVSVTDLWTGDTAFVDGAVGGINASVAAHDSAVFRVSSECHLMAS